MAPLPERPQDDHDQKPSSPPQENPFIRFRQFADAQIGSLLQGIIGLPSTFTKQATSKPRWADFDEELRRRNELQAKQKQLKGGPSETSGHEPQAEAPEEWKNPKNSQAPGSVDIGPIQHKDIPLYSPVSKTLFANLEPGCAPQWTSDVHKPGNVTSYRWEFLPFEVREDQHPSSVLRSVQFMAYNDLNRSPYLRSNYSLLPYLLFSPYSPISLEEEAGKKEVEQVRNGVQVSKPTFPFKAAFEDLIQSTQNVTERRPSYFDYFSSFTGLRGWNNQAASSVNHMGWIYNLYAGNILQERGQQELPQMRQFWHISPFANLGLGVLQAHSSEKGVEKSTVSKEYVDKSNDPETEQEMYDRFLEWVSTPSEVFKSVDRISKDPGGWFSEQIALLESEKGRNTMRKMIETQFPKEVSSLFETLEKWEKDASEIRLKREQGHDGLLEGLYDPLGRGDSLPSTVDENPLQKQNHTSNDRADRVVSTSTTTEHTTHEDGSVETNVTVWKRFADGRESTTTTNHFANPPCDENGNPVQVERLYQNEELGDTGKEMEKVKKGWFWN